MSEQPGYREPLPADDVFRAIEGKRPRRVPMILHPWNNPKAYEPDGLAPHVTLMQHAYPCDVVCLRATMPAFWDNPGSDSYVPGYSWMHTPPPEDWSARKAFEGQAVALPDLDALDEVLAAWPDPEAPALLAGLADRLQREGDGRYSLLYWPHCYFERMWSMRGRENLLRDFSEHPGQVHRLMDALGDFYETLIRRAGEELNVNAVWTTDDIGGDSGPAFSRAIFEEFFKPRYQRLIDAAHRQGMHFWLHTCGDVSEFLPDFVQIGLDVIHPIQAGVMDSQKTAETYRGKICFWAGLDVAEVLPGRSAGEVRKEVRKLIDTFDHADGGCMITAGNGIGRDVSLENLRAFYDEAYHYGLAHRQQYEGEG